MRKTIYAFTRALQHIRRNPIPASVTVATVAVVFLVLSALASLGYNLDRLAARLQSGLVFRVYLDDRIEPGARAAIEAGIRGSDLVQSLEYIDSERARERFRTQLAGQAEVIDVLEQNPLPASFEARVKDPARHLGELKSLASRLSGLPGVEEVQYGQDWLDRLFSFLDLVRMVGLVIGSLVVFATLLIVSNTIRLSVYARREELNILKLVGATDGFIKGPFYIEGALLGTLGAGLGLAVAAGMFLSVASGVGIPMSPLSPPLMLGFLPPESWSIALLGGACIGLLGTFSSLWRHMRIR